ncbi:argininosuccinate synthase domain-containing protein, partial [Staphylococcus aureus]|uniref:argininosuccinate synthase domain-containing protein n=1 Tax=Staphylococcus aureus TaxID=1280 RepID=UPI0037DA1270
MHKPSHVVPSSLHLRQSKHLHILYKKPLHIPPLQSHIIHPTKQFTHHYLTYPIKPNLIYQNPYPLLSPLSTPLIPKKLLQIAHKTNSLPIPHPSTPK